MNPTIRRSGRSRRISKNRRLSLEGGAYHWNHREDTDYFSQPGALFRLMNAQQQQVLFDNTARSIGGAPQEIQLGHIANCMNADPAYGAGIAKAMNISAKGIAG
jgi:catalase